MMADINPSDVLREAIDLKDRGAFAEALEKHLWFHHEAILASRAFYGVRLSYALRAWMDLGNVYPPARAALEAVRDEAATALRNGGTDRLLFEEVASISDLLNEPTPTRDLFAEIAARDRELARRCFESALPSLLKTKEFKLARSFIFLPESTLERYLSQLNGNLQQPPQTSREKDAYIAIYAEDVKNLLEVLIGTGELDEARHIHTTALERISDPAIRACVREQIAVDLEN